MPFGNFSIYKCNMIIVLLTIQFTFLIQHMIPNEYNWNKLTPTFFPLDVDSSMSVTYSG